MVQYIPFIHKLPKKQKEQPPQIPLYIEYYPVEEEKSKEKDKKENITIIELF